MRKPPVRKSVPTFGDEQAEREFWETHDASPFADWERARVAVFPHLKPSSETISLRLPSALLAELKALANKRDVPYQSLLKIFLADRVASEITRAGVRRIGASAATSHRNRAARARRSAPSGRSR